MQFLLENTKKLDMERILLEEQLKKYRFLHTYETIEIPRKCQENVYPVGTIPFVENCLQLHENPIEIPKYLRTDMNLIQKFRKIALSIESYDTKAMEQLRMMLPEIEKTTKLRVINVLNERMTTEDCLAYINNMQDIGVKQVTFRQMFGNRNAYQNFLKVKDTIDIPGVMFLPDGEYHNYYFTTNNKLYPYFFGYTEEDRKTWMKKYEEIESTCG